MSITPMQGGVGFCFVLFFSLFFNGEVCLFKMVLSKNGQGTGKNPSHALLWGSKPECKPFKKQFDNMP